jgi:hypothetical protein
MRTLIKIHVLLGKTALQCYKAYETVRQQVNGNKNGWKETDDAPCSASPTSATDEHHMEQVKSVLEHICNISYKAIAKVVRISPVFTVSSLISRWNKESVQTGIQTS